MVLAIILSLIGLALAVSAWEHINPVVGLLVGVLFIGGGGWNLLGALLSCLRPSGKSAFGAKGKEFIKAWEDQNGPMVRGVESSKPPVGWFQKWLRANRAHDTSAAVWVREAGRTVIY